MAEEKAELSNVTFTGEERIRQLADIDKNIAAMLQAAGEAIQALANHSDKNVPLRSDEDARAAFTSATSRYFSLLSSVDVNLRRQIWALEEANIIAPGSVEKENQSGKGKAAPDLTSLGSLDVGWLNSRNDKVGKEMEAELWEKASSLMAARNQEGGDKQDSGDVSMEK